MRIIRTLAFGATLALAAFATLPATAQIDGGNTPARTDSIDPPGGALPDGADPSGANPTTEAPTEQQLLNALQGGRIDGRVSIPDSKSAILEQPQGRDYRAFREGWLPWIAGIAILGMLAALAIFYFVRGRILTEPSEFTGRKILRFSFFERFNHWMTATAFILLALTGLNYIFGKRLLAPIMGPDAFATMSQWGKYIHMYVSWAFMLGVIFMIVVWIKDNIPSKTDVRWVKELGGFVGDHHPPARRFNAGQKMIFWAVALGGVALSITGILMLFPFSALDVNGMQTAQYIHATVGVLLVAIMIAHIYIGSLGMKGAYDAMGSGKVDLGWAKTHHSLWVEEEQAKTAKGAQLRPDATPAE
ncbi:MAG: formate dehydrogenase subunit gamma [Aurantimonas endophytica]|uniref:Formate dehydrogenase subunit gamma n=1 Tax=Aurantimonas endophytica TaxID=1522175 RepID=A0A7W6MNI8_9HYPH|nr:formate dehydrogenase subunit gamma [Aurantimonas endophytica]MBB4002010.1 formate dehydrogenase subunit gamma [Aurantimonas endophytica]MCO6402357.1 formate dehydrogenase subunit gamma [Aurantimonas endophytica]